MSNIIKSAIQKLLTFFNFSFNKRINGRLFRIPILGNLGIANRKIEDQWMVEILNLIIPYSNSKFIDVGVNIGQTLLKVKSVDHNIQYIGFEPNPACLFYLDKLVKHNKLENALIVPAGIALKTNIETLHFYNGNDAESSASIMSKFRNQARTHTKKVSVFSVKDLQLSINFDGMSILKIDVEGSEAEVLEGFKNLIAKNNPFILIEILPVYNDLKKPERLASQNHIQSLLKNLRYKMFRIEKSKNSLEGFTEIFDIGVHSDLNNCDYIGVPEIKIELFKSLILKQKLKIFSE